MAVDLSGGGSKQGYPSGGTYTGAGAADGSNLDGQFGAQMAQAALQDPGVQAHIKEAAYQQAQVGMQAAKEGAAQAVQELKKYVQEGPAGISVLCFLGGGATFIIGFLGLLSIGDIFGEPFQYVLNAYLCMFGIVTFLLEADVESVKNLRVLGRLYPWVERYQIEVFNRANFLTELRGRGFFYTFIGTLAITQCFLCLHFLAGLWNLLMGVLCLMMSFGINPADHMDLASQHQGYGHYGQPAPSHDVPLFDARHGP
eukprot:TRINITY_DN109123_c0_g1_i1.p1 TRINITY_DN109123_c0_g1~~TRINITY_DN109123_c0_g1_i1.p1  ORF type:complete len:256 (+),score=51.76 TRINITY_DN109123_c0_g1_i1:83-850(+)